MEGQDPEFRHQRRIIALGDPFPDLEQIAGLETFTRWEVPETGQGLVVTCHWLSGGREDREVKCFVEKRRANLPRKLRFYR